MPVCVSCNAQDRHKGRDDGAGADRAPEAARPADERRCGHDPHGHKQEDELGDQNQRGLLNVAESTRWDSWALLFSIRIRHADEPGYGLEVFLTAAGAFLPGAPASDVFVLD